MKSRIMYIEEKSSLNGPARIGRVTFSKSGRTVRYQNRKFQNLSGAGFKANFFEVGTGNHYWLSGPHRDGRDRLYGHPLKADEIDADVWDEYWRDVRKRPAPKRS